MNRDRIFIVSDLHGSGKVYFGIINYLEKLQEMYPNQRIILYINGDLIDRGNDSIKMLLDVMERVKGKGNIEVHMMAGNHELIMYEAIMNRRNGVWPECSWLVPSNGGIGTVCDFEKLSLDKQNEIKMFLRNLPLAVKFDGYIVGKKGIVLSHACPPKILKDIDRYGMTLKDAYYDRKIADIVWKRDKDLSSGETIGLEEHFSIIGHTNTKTKSGFKYNKKDCCLNIDGGCGFKSNKEELRVPVVELDYVRDKIKIHGFDCNGLCKYRRIFAENGEVVTKKTTSTKGKHLTKKKSLYDKLIELASISRCEFYKFINLNKTKLAAIGILVGLLAVGGNYVSETDDFSISISDEFFDENGLGTIDIKIEDEVIPVMCNSVEVNELLDEVSCNDGECLESIAERYSTTVSTLVDLNSNLVECNDGVYYTCSDEIIVPDSEIIEKKLIKNYK